MIISTELSRVINEVYEVELKIDRAKQLMVLLYEIYFDMRIYEDTKEDIITTHELYRAYPMCAALVNCMLSLLSDTCKDLSVLSSIRVIPEEEVAPHAAARSVSQT